MKKIIEKLLDRLGYVAIKKSSLKSGEEIKGISKRTMAYARGKSDLGLMETLRQNNQLRWLEVGTGGRDFDGFDKIDIIDFPPGTAPSNYKKLDIINCTDEELKGLGTYDLVRMQHVFEHFTPEDGLKVLHNCSKVLKKGGYILISVPDIDIIIDRYKNGTIRQLPGNWGHDRIGDNAPDSFFLCIFLYSVLSEPHLWSYNAEGLVHQLQKTGSFENIEVLDFGNPKSSTPFTHNRPDEDVVVLAQRK
jgi:predicted SAM-dependent methyltransferase